MAEQQVELARPIDAVVLQEWYDKHGIVPDADGNITNLPYGESPVGDNTIVEQVKVNAARHNIPNLRGAVLQPAAMVYVGGGPSLHEFLEDIRAKCSDPAYHVWTSNMTARFLVSKGIKPQFHVVLDPTERILTRGDLDYDSPETTLVLGLQCWPGLFDKALEDGRTVRKFLAASATGGDITDTEAAMAACTVEDPELIGIGGGSMTGTRMLYLASAMGYRKLELYGVDACVDYKNGHSRAYAYTKIRGEHILEVEASNGRKWFSTTAMARQCDEMTRLWTKLPGLEIDVFGDTFMANHVMLMKHNNAPASYRISDYYRAQLAQMHEEHTTFGSAGQLHAPRVFMAAAQLVRKVGKCDVLDYGAGKGRLVDAILAAFPDVPGITYRNYEPAFGAADPEPAELVTCFDVLEHVEPECVQPVLEHLRDLTQWIGIFTISMRPAYKHLPDGRNAHICLHDKDWWLSWLRRYFIIVECQPLPDQDFIVVVQPIDRYLARAAEKAAA